MLIQGAGRAVDNPNRLVTVDANVHQTVTIGGGSIRSSTNLYVTGNSYISSNIVTGGSIGIANTSPGHDLSIGSNLYVTQTGSNVLVTSGNVSASRYHGNAKYLTNTTDEAPGTYGGVIDGQNANIAVITIGTTGRVETVSNVPFAVTETSNLAQVVNRGNVTSNTVRFTNATTSFVSSSNVGIGNTNPQHILSIGSGEVFINSNIIILGSGDNISIGTTKAEQESNAIAIGTLAGETSQESNTVAIGVNAGRSNQSTKGVAIGDRAGESNQHEGGISIGEKAGQSTQGSAAIAIGKQAGQTSQGSNAVAIGTLTGSDRQGDYSIAIGDQAAPILQGSNAIAIGNKAGLGTAASNTIILNASGQPLNSVAEDSVYIKNFRNSTTQYTNVLSSNLSSGEVITSSIVVSGSNVGLGGNTAPDHELSVDGNTYSNLITQIIRFDDGVEQATIEGLTLLDVTQNGNTTVENIQFNNSTTSFVTASNVGIANANPQDALSVTGNVFISGSFTADSISGNMQATTLTFSSEPTEVFSSLSLQDICDVGATYVGSSNVGIGTATPASKLEVIGTVTANAYAPFTGVHFVSHTTNQVIADGSVMVSTGKVTKNSVIDTIPEVCLSSKPRQKTVLGASHTDPQTDRMTVVSLGEGQVMVCNENGPVLNGDYICSSSRVGMGMRQSDDILHNYTIAKATENCMFNTENNCLVACTFHSG